ncbi:MAG: S8 family serine peptidase [candidate division Zixibacteria bacterium]|nr:S8 family serine peptidase [candidate division Zixibacteria bacterium]
MKTREVILVLICIILFATPLYPASFNGKNILKGIWMGKEIEYVEGEILFKMKSEVKLSEVEGFFRENKAKIVEGPDRLGMGRVELASRGDVFQVIENLNSSDLIEFAEPNMIDKAMYPPNDYYFEDGYQWGLYNYGQTPPAGTPGADINATAGWDISVGSSDVLIAILDSGVPMIVGFLFHPDLADTSRYVLGEDMTGDGEWVKDNYGHGTHVLGIIAAVTNNEAGVAGVDWNCRILIDQVFDSSGIGTHNTFKNGVLHAVDYGARVINYSGGGLASFIKEEAVRYADSNNVLLVSAAGNGFGGSVIYPAHYADSYLNVIAVSATTCDDQLASYSNYGPSICVAAPGGGGISWDENDIFSTTPNYPVTLSGPPYYLTQTYGYMAGTSMSCGMVTGLASLLLSTEPNFNAYELREIIEESADQVGDYMYYIETGKSFELGHGRINCYDALVLASGYTYVYGDANGDGIVTLGDLVFILNYLFRDGPPPEPLSAGDPNGDCTIAIGDVVYLINYLFRMGPPLLRGCVGE